MSKTMREETGSFSKYNHQKLQRLYTQGGSLYRSVQNLVKTSRLPASKVRQFLHRKRSHTKFTFAMRNFRRMKAFASFINGTWCMDPACVDNLAKDNKGVKYLPVCQVLFDRIVLVKGMKTSDSSGNLRAISKTITKQNRPRTFWSTEE